MSANRIIGLVLTLSLGGCGTLDDIRDVEPGCFAFPGPGTDGWTLDGVMDGAGPDSLGSAFFSWSTFEGGFWLGSLMARINLSQVQTPTSGFWRFDFVSPDLKQRPEWQNVSTVFVRIRSEQIGPDPIQAQTIFTYRYPDGSQQSFFPGPADDPVFYPLAGLTEFRPSTDLEEAGGGAVLETIRIRIFVPSLPDPKFAPDGIATVYLVGVCPTDG